MLTSIIQYGGKTDEKENNFVFIVSINGYVFNRLCNYQNNCKRIKKAKWYCKIVTEGPGYKLPDGYTLHSDPKDTSRISIICQTEQDDTITAEYVIEGKEAHLDSFEIENIGAVGMDGMMICFVIGLIVGVVITMLVAIS